MKRFTSVIAIAIAALMAFAALASVASGAPGQEKKLRKAVTVQGMLQHEQAFQNIANANDGTRASGTDGYQDSVDYVVDQLEAAGYNPEVQPFDFAFFQELAPPTFEQTSPNEVTYVEDEDFATMDYSGSGDVTALVEESAGNQFPPGAEPSSSAAGCADSDFDGFTDGNVALIQRGTCTFGEKALNAQEAGASAVIIFNEGQEGRTEALAGTLGNPDFTIPVIGSSFAVGEELHNLLQSGDVEVHIVTSTISETRETYNVLADTKGGNGHRVIVQGSHLDSVVDGPGINDNGSGSAYNLESAIQVAKQIQPKNKIRFAFWGAEEANLIGSTYYVENLSGNELGDIELNLNHDMLASPNFVRFVYDGDGSDTDTAGPNGSAQIEQTFLNYFDSQGLETEPTAFDGRSDYGPFIDVGIPAGGLFSGAEGVKTEEEADIYGGVVGEAYDRCYHQACDTFSNLSTKSLNQLSNGAATALAHYALAQKTVTGAKAKKVSAKKAKAKAAKRLYLGDLLQR